MTKDQISVFKAAGALIGWVIATLASLFAIYQLSEQISVALVPQLVNQRPKGHKLPADEYEINVLLLTLLIIVLIVALCIIATALRNLTIGPTNKDAAIVKTIEQSETFTKEIRDKEKESKETIDAYNHVVARSRRIVDGLDPYQLGEKKLLDVISIDVSIDIYEEFGAKVIKRYKVRCNDQPAAFYRYWFAADNAAPELTTLHPTDFLAKFVEGGGDISAIPYINEPRNKGVALFFLPPIKPQEMVTFEVHYSWPGFFADLKTTGASIYFLQQDSGGTARVSCVFSFEKSLGEIEADLVNLPAGAQLIKEENKNIRSWIYKNENFRCDGSEYQIKFLRTDKSKTAPLA